MWRQPQHAPRCQPASIVRFPAQENGFLSTDLDCLEVNILYTRKFQLVREGLVMGNHVSGAFIIKLLLLIKR